MPDEPQEAPQGAMVNTIVIAIGGRKVAWRASDQVIAIIAQGLVQTLGPGEEVQ